jgi:SagB-type dehydrogenase family enzyme
MKKALFFLSALILRFMLLYGQEIKTIQLNPPDLNRGLPVMKALSLRASVREYSSEKLSLQDLSDLLWAANGINRPEKGGRTAPSSMNSQDIDIYVFLEEGAYLYDPKNNRLTPVVSGDYRAISGTQDFVGAAPVSLVLVSDISRFRSGTNEEKLKSAAYDAGIVSQNISVFCASIGLATVPRAGVDAAKVKPLLKLTDTQYIMLNHPVGYPKN